MNILDYAKFPLLSLYMDGFDHHSPFPNQSCNKKGSLSAPGFGAWGDAQFIFDGLTQPYM